MRRAVALSIAVSFAALLAAQTKDAATACAALSRLTMPATTITLAQIVDAGAFVPPSQPVPPPLSAGGAPCPPDRPIYSELPAFCRVAATLRPSSDSDIKIEVWLPATGWNGKFQAVGNGYLQDTSESGA
jgi:feruloyl esterase